MLGRENDPAEGGRPGLPMGLAGLAGYRDLVEIHRGARHVVLRGWRESDGSAVVIKAALGPDAGAEAAQRLRHEHDVLARLDVPAISRPLDFERNAGLTALVLANAGAQNLRRWLHRRRLRPDVFLRLGMQLAQVLAELHERGVVHRDISPDNIVVGEGERLTLIDFEAAMMIGEGALVAPALLEGALPYIAPEATGRTSRLVDHRADLYSLGALFYEMLVGAPPFLSSDPVELVHAHLAVAPVPPVTVNPSLPTLLSDLVLKLLRKNPDRRYQSAGALLSDLRQAQERLSQSGEIPAFELGLLDLAHDLPLPETLYGRDSARSELAAAWHRVLGGRAEVVLVAGAAGVGKTALVEDLRAQVVARAGRFVSGKFDLRRGGAPYAPIQEAFGELTQIVLATPSEAAIYRDRLAAALGSSGGVITELLPELEQLMGKQPVVPALGPQATKSRFELTFQAFAQALATPEHPLVLFIDDLQWGDSASLDLIRQLATAEGIGPVLIVGAYRPEEVAPDHPLSALLGALAARGAPAKLIELQPLGAFDVLSLCAEALRCSAAQVAPLAALVAGKTAGNPLFVRRLLHHLHREGLLVLDPIPGVWSWDLARIGEVAVSDNVVELLIAGLQRLPQATQEVLTAAACIGRKAPVHLLAAVTGRPAEGIVGDLSRPLDEGLVAMRSAQASAAMSGGVIQFVHDRVQQAAYALAGEQRRRAIHLKIGHILASAAGEDAAGRGEGGEEGFAAGVFATVDQLNLGVDLVSDPAEKLAIATRNLSAARKARTSSAYGPALAYLRRALALMPDDAWQTQADLAFQLHCEAAECAYMVDDPAQAEQLCEHALAHTASLPQQVTLCVVMIQGCVARFDVARANHWADRGLGLLGIELPVDAAGGAYAAELADVRRRVAERPSEQILEAPLMQDPEQIAAMLLLSKLVEVAFVARQPRFPFIIARMVALSLRHGNSVSSAHAYANLGWKIAGMGDDDCVLGHRLMRLGVDLARRFGDPAQLPRTLQYFAGASWLEPFETRMPLLRESAAVALSVGNITAATGGAGSIAAQMYHRGTPLGQVLAEFDALAELGRKTGGWLIMPYCALYRQTVRCLQGLTQERGRFDQAAFEGYEFKAGKAYAGAYTARRVEVAYLFGDIAGARDAVDALGDEERGYGRDHEVVDYTFYSALTFVAASETAQGAEREGLLLRLRSNQKLLATWAGLCPENFRHKHLLLEAEIARIEGRPLEAAAHYEGAIEAATHDGFLQQEALGNELCGRFYRGLGLKRTASGYLREARDCYLRWGATDKADMLEEQFAELATASQAPARRGSATDEATAFDTLGLARAAETISSEVMLPRLLGKLMEVCLAMAGAQRGAFLLEEEGGLFLRAVAVVNEPVVLLQTAATASGDLPLSILDHVRGGTDALMLPDAAHQGAFRDDPYVVARSVASVLTLPIRLQSKNVGILYLENNLATRAFTPDHVRLLQLLSSQIAVALENSRLFEKLLAEIEERRRAEASVQLLAGAGLALSESLDYQQTSAKVVRLALPFLADWCALDVLEAGRIRRLAAAHVDPAKQALLEEFRHRLGQKGPAIPLYALQVFETGRSLLLSDVTNADMASYVPDPELRELIEIIGVKSGMAVPLLGRGQQPIGVMLFASDSQDRRYGARDLALAEELARRAAMALDNARLYGETREAVRLRDDFLTLSSHELNTPTAVLTLTLSSLSQLAEAECERAQVLPLVRRAHRQGQRLKKLIGELLDVTTIDRGLLVLAPKPIELRDLVHDVVDSLAPEFRGAGCEVTLDLAPVTGQWDEARLRQVVRNLLSNAAKFGERQPIEVRGGQVGDDAWLSVTDHGTGIDPERLPHIFDKFERAVSVEHYGGLGLGLYLCRRLVELHGGTIVVQSEPGQGATFRLTLPRQRPTRSRQRAPSHLRPNNPSPESE